MTRKGIAFSPLCVLCCIVSSLAFVFEDCGSEVGKFNEISISSCDSSEEKCSIMRDSETHLSIKFIPSVDVSKIEAHAFGLLGDIPVPFPLEKPEVCKDSSSGINCPLKKDQEVEYKATFFVEKTTPALSLNVMWDFRNEKDEKIICVKFPVKIK
ncbi:unnamed protein product [Lasius platythorax]|uniref:MD-2-related lipid-recognition domain-containing protein n=1 Tax=Lasius platythorax TaxID=488582 RepID=A0AAV2N1K5_9HYME